MKNQYNKLVRDGIPINIERDGLAYKARELDAVTFRSELLKKLVEEANEVANAASISDVVEELADLQEVISAILQSFEIEEEEIEAARLEKFEKNGGFEKKIFLEFVETPKQ